MAVMTGTKKARIKKKLMLGVVSPMRVNNTPIKPI
jgi:hypothetical protein